jgi:hypothetical protein
MSAPFIARMIVVRVVQALILVPGTAVCGVAVWLDAHPLRRG